MKIAIVGSGLYGATVASLMTGNEVSVYESNSEQIGGNVATKFSEEANCHVSLHGAHIFHTNSDKVWNYINKFSKFNNYRHYVKGELENGEMVDLPFGMSMFEKLLGIRAPNEARAYFNSMVGDNCLDTVEGWCLENIGLELYEKVVKNYTEKQWGRKCSELPASIIRRLPMRFTYDNTYFHNAKYQGMPVDGYSAIIDKMLEGAGVYTCNVDMERLRWLSTKYDQVFFSGALDRLFNYSEGVLPYRGLRFEDHVYDVEHMLGAPVINDLSEAAYTRRIEHKMFYPERVVSKKTVVTTEYPAEWSPGETPYYPIRDEKSAALHKVYVDRMEKEFPNVTIGGRLGSYQYYDMDQVVAMAMADVGEEK